MRRLLQIGTLLFIVAAVLMPVLEFFDRWDSPGIGNDTEFAVFALLLLLSLVLLVGCLIALMARRIPMRSDRLEAGERLFARDAAGAGADVAPPLLRPPLRI